MHSYRSELVEALLVYGLGVSVGSSARVNTLAYVTCNFNVPSRRIQPYGNAFPGVYSRTLHAIRVNSKVGLHCLFHCAGGGQAPYQDNVMLYAVSEHAYCTSAD